MTQLDAYRNRITSVTNELNAIKDKLILLGWIPIRTDEAYTFRKLYKDDKIVTFGFADVPYRWYINSEHRTQSSDIINYNTSLDNYDTFPFTIAQIIDSAQTMDSRDIFVIERINNPQF